jgi:hypothetical protein
MTCDEEPKDEEPKIVKRVTESCEKTSATVRGSLWSVAAARALLAIAIASSWISCGGKTPGPGGADGQGSGLVAWESVRSVLQHPRCQNCHPQDDVPLQGDDGQPHGQNVQRGPEGRGLVGMECVTCHGPGNLPASYGLNVPPGIATGWRMPKPELKLVFVGMSTQALCEQVKDPARNGGLDMPGLRHHLEDPLVTWGWAPGTGRAAIPMPRETFLAAWQTWSDAGAPCPTMK